MASMIQSQPATAARSVVEPAGADERLRRGREEGIRLERARPLEPLARGLRRDVEQQHRHAGVGEVRRNLRAHRARAEDRRTFEVIAVNVPQAPDEEIDDRVRFGDQRVLPPAQDPVGGHLVERAEEELRGRASG